MIPQPRQRFSAQVTLTPPAVSEFARSTGDLNPVHHDAQYASTTRFRRVIASGAQTTSLLMGLTATYFSQASSMLGLEFWFRFRRPVFADETIRLEWLIISATAAPRLNGTIVELRGRVRNEAGETAVGAKGGVLVSDTL